MITKSESNISNIKIELHSHKNEIKVISNKRFFKTNPGEYGEDDKFIGVSVPIIRKIAAKYKNVKLQYLKELIYSEIHEERFLALVILVIKFRNASNNKEPIYNFYLDHINQINNWDLVDISAKEIIGYYLYYNEGLQDLLLKLANSKNLWHRRIAIISTFYFIKKGYYKKTLNLAKLLINDKQDLIHKAIGWMLREIGKKDLEILKSFLNENIKKMPRTMLRYAIEKFDEDSRNFYMNIK
ncbi:MAG: DNA alkylation repair protein [Bacteroidetes bacterium]|nr:DNA alkylation repair protein [Bacteroidota bacterium]